MKHSWQEYADGAKCRRCGAIRRQGNDRVTSRVVGWEETEYGESYPVTENDYHSTVEVVGADSPTKCKGKS